MESLPGSARPWVWTSGTDLRDLLWETWDDEHFVFNPRSGETHVLNELAGAMLRALAERPRTAAELTAEFREGLSGTDQDVEHAVTALLAQLDQLGLVDGGPP
ncbi:MAG: HPr-rel-A system PqqD family peptide chaperone [Chromatiales bacterium]